MSPKFKGGSDDWLDDEKSGRRSIKVKKAKPQKERHVPKAKANALVAEVFPKQCRVRFFDGKEQLCNYRRASVFNTQGTRERAPVAVGDWVRVEGDIVEGVSERKNQIVRPSPDRKDTLLHVIAANLDYLVIVASAHDPEFTSGLVDRFLISAATQGISSILVINKADLLKPEDEKPWQVYSDLGILVFELSAKGRFGTDPLKKQIERKTVAFCGHSGVGKTSLLNVLLLGQYEGRVTDVNEFHGKGRHTTTGAILLPTSHEDSFWIDTPGVREFGLVGVEPENLRDFFPEFSRLDCFRDHDCHHLEEPFCQARTLTRYPSYKRLFESVAAGEN